MYIWDVMAMWVEDGFLDLNWSLRQALEEARGQKLATELVDQFAGFLSAGDGDWDRTKVEHLQAGQIVDHEGQVIALGWGPSHLWWA
jgi:hypothetical protein